MTDCVNKIYTMETTAVCDSDILQTSTSGSHPNSIESVNSNDKVDDDSQNIIHATDESELIYCTFCPICQEDFEEPKLLPCGHHLCRKCLIALYSMTSATFLCPVCRRCIQNYEKQTHPMVYSDTQGKNTTISIAVDTPEVSHIHALSRKSLEATFLQCSSLASENASSESESLADSLPTDTVVAALVDGRRILQSPHVCIGCESGAEAVNFCFHCGDKLCISCSACHARLACTRHHEVKPLLDLTPVQLAIYTREHCPLHADQYLDLYCPVHSQPMCIHCVSENHADCTAIKTITNAAQQQRWILEQQIEKVNKANNSLEELSKIICHRQEALSDSQQSSCHEVSRLFARLRAVLVSCEEKLIAAVNEVSSPLKGYLQEQSASVEHDRKCLAAYLEHTANFFRTTSHVNITRMAGTLVACGARLVAEIPSFLVKSSTEVVVLDVDNSLVSQIEELCHKLGRVKVTSLESLSSSRTTATSTFLQQKSPLKSRDGETVKDYKPNVDFKPVIELPELIQVKTGEEDEIKSLSEMFRPKEGSWECSGCLVMNSAATWRCPACQTLKPEDVKQSLSEMFKPKEGSWECSGCLIQNSAFVQKCPACQTLKPGLKLEDIKSAVSSISGTSSTPSSGGFGGFKFGGTTEADKPGTGSGFKFGVQPGSAPTGFKVGSGGSKSGTAESGFKFVVPASKNIQGPSAGSTGFKFMLPEVSGFKFGTTSSSTSVSTTGCGFGGVSTIAATTTLTSTVTSTTSTSSGFIFPNQSGDKDGSGSLLMTEDKTSTDQSAKGFAFNSSVQSSSSAEQTKSGPGWMSSFPTPSSESFKASGFQAKLGQVTSPTIQAGSERKETGFQFTFSMTPQTQYQKAQQLAISPKSPNADNNGHYLNKDGEDSHIFFEPVVPLPEKVEVKTGEEEEIPLFENRAKLYRFVEGEWKEKGRGVFKILEHRENGRTRVLMRRDQVLKICCNHYISMDLDMKPMARSAGKAWIWYAMDFSEGEGKMEQLAVRFRDVETANKFKVIFDKSKEKITTPNKTSAISVQSNGVASSTAEGASRKPFTEQDDDVIFVHEEKPTADQIECARKLLLPDTFCLYENRPGCPGCIGCEDYDPCRSPAVGEEEWEPLFVQRAKLYRFDSNQWKERGIGEMKLMKHKEKLAFRVLMRREQVLKVACNHMITPLMELRPMTTSETAWCWIANDFTENEPRAEQFAVKFKNVELAKEFKSKFEDCQEKLRKGELHAPVQETVTLTSQQGTDHHDSAITSEQYTEENENSYYSQLNAEATGIITGSIQAIMDEQGSKHFMQSMDTISGTRGSQYYSPQEETITQSEQSITGDRGNLMYSAELDVNAEDRLGASEQLFTGDRGNPYYSRQLDFGAKDAHTDTDDHLNDFFQELNVGAENAVTSQRHCLIGDKGNLYYTTELNVRAEDLVTSSSTSKHTDIFYTQEQNVGAEDSETESFQTASGDSERNEDLGHYDDESHDVEEDEDEEEEEEEGTEEEEEQRVEFEKRVTLHEYKDEHWEKLGLGHLRVLYNQDLESNSVDFVTDSNQQICNHIICRETSISVDSSSKSCEWRPLDFVTNEPIRRHFKAVFSSEPAAQEFANIFRQGQQLAAENEISEKLSEEIDVPEVFSAGDQASLS